jgi:hypothetical protein
MVCIYTGTARFFSLLKHHSPGCGHSPRAPVFFLCFFFYRLYFSSHGLCVHHGKLEERAFVLARGLECFPNRPDQRYDLMKDEMDIPRGVLEEGECCSQE